MATESDVEKKLIKYCSQIGTTVFKNNTGSAYRGVMKRDIKNRRVIVMPQLVSYGLIKGSSDLIGITPKIITQDMVGQKIGIFTALEVKKNKKGNYRATPEQKAFIQMIKNNGGMAGVVDCEKDVDLIVEKQ